MTRPFYRFAGREPRTNGLTDALIWRNENDPHDKVIASEWWFWRLWRYHPGNEAHPLYEGPR